MSYVLVIVFRLFISKNLLDIIFRFLLLVRFKLIKCVRLFLSGQSDRVFQYIELSPNWINTR